MEPNPYVSPESSRVYSGVSRVVDKYELLWSAYLVASVLIALIPCCGYFVGVYRVPQDTFFGLLLAWVLTPVNIVALYFHSRDLIERDSRLKLVWALAWVWIVATFVIGIGGLWFAMMELLAG